MGLFQFANSMGYISKLGQDLIKKSGIELIQDLWMICGGVVAFLHSDITELMEKGLKSLKQYTS